MNLERTLANLEKRGFQARYFSTKEQAADYLVENIRETTVGIGGSITIEELGVYDRLCGNNRVFWHWKDRAPDILDNAHGGAKVYLTSANGVAETGEIINIDGTGNRVAATLFGRETVYIIIGINKIAEDYDKALWRARNIASPKNAQRLRKKTPCAVKGDKCYDCSSPERICRGLVVLWGPMKGNRKTEVVIVGEELGY